MGHGLTGYAQTNIQLYEELRAAGASDEEMRQVAHAYELAVRLFTAQYRCSGKPLLSHLVGTASILARHGADLPVVLGGLLHAAYQLGDFGTVHPGVTAGKRQQVRDSVGREVEALIARYGDLKCYLWPASSVASRVEALPVTDRRVLFMRAANELEESLDYGFLYCTEEKRQSSTDVLALMALISESVGKQSLAGELRLSHTRISTGRIPEALSTGRRGTYTVFPACARQPLGIRLRNRVIALLLSVWRFLPRRIRHYLRS